MRSMEEEVDSGGEWGLDRQRKGDSMNSRGGSGRHRVQRKVVPITWGRVSAKCGRQAGTRLQGAPRDSLNSVGCVLQAVRNLKRDIHVLSGWIGEHH